MKHIYSNDYIQDYLPHREYHGRSGYVQYFLEGLNYAINDNSQSYKYKTNMRKEELNFINIARNMSIVRMREDMYLSILRRLSKSLIMEIIKENNIELMDSNLYYLECFVLKDSNHSRIEIDFHDYNNDIKINFNDREVIKQIINFEITNNNLHNILTLNINNKLRKAYLLCMIESLIDKKDKRYPNYYFFQCDMSTYFYNNGDIELNLEC